LSNRDVEERADDFRVELRARASGQFLSRISWTRRALVGARGGHDLKDVGDRDDACSEGDLISGDSEGISRTIVVFVVLLDGEAPVTQPRLDRSDQSTTL
jgi:hypothetical protein